MKKIQNLGKPQNEFKHKVFFSGVRIRKSTAQQDAIY